MAQIKKITGFTGYRVTGKSVKDGTPSGGEGIIYSGDNGGIFCHTCKATMVPAKMVPAGYRRKLCAHIVAFNHPDNDWKGIEGKRAEKALAFSALSDNLKD